jgi:putative two-component system response regulator
MELNAKTTILIIDSVPDNLVRMEGLLQDHHHVKLARLGADGLRIAALSPRPDLIVLGAQLSDMGGMAVLRDLKANFLTADIAVLFAADPDARSLQREALGAGAADLLELPLLPELLRARVDTQLQLRQARALLKDQHSHFELLVAQRTREVALLQDATILAMASLAESRDQGVGQHIRRTQHYVMALARELRFQASYTAELTDDNIALLFKAAPLHDIGKVGVPDAILLKPGKLTSEEFEQMKRHTVYGRDAIANVEATLGGPTQFTRYASEITYSHQEKWDGSGYPQGLEGTAIPLSARMMAVADVYDALITERAYRPAFTHETAVELIRQCSGSHFDPDVVDAMLAIEEKFNDIALEFGIAAA